MHCATWVAWSTVALQDLCAYCLETAPTSRSSVIGGLRMLCSADEDEMFARICALALKMLIVKALKFPGLEFFCSTHLKTRKFPKIIQKTFFG